MPGVPLVDCLRRRPPLFGRTPRLRESTQPIYSNRVTQIGILGCGTGRWPSILFMHGTAESGKHMNEKCSCPFLYSLDGISCLVCGKPLDLAGRTGGRVSFDSPLLGRRAYSVGGKNDLYGTASNDALRQTGGGLVGAGCGCTVGIVLAVPVKLAAGAVFATNPPVLIVVSFVIGTITLGGAALGYTNPSGTEQFLQNTVSSLLKRWPFR